MFQGKKFLIIKYFQSFKNVKLINLVVEFFSKIETIKRLNIGSNKGLISSPLKCTLGRLASFSITATGVCCESLKFLISF